MRIFLFIIFSAVISQAATCDYKSDGTDKIKIFFDPVFGSSELITCRKEKEGSRVYNCSNGKKAVFENINGFGFRYRWTSCVNRWRH